MHWHVHAYSGGTPHYRPIPRALPLRGFAFSRSHREFGTRTSRKNYGIVLQTTERLIHRPLLESAVPRQRCSKEAPLRGASYDHWIGCSKPGRWIQIIQKGAWACVLANGPNGMSDIEGKVAREAMSECGQRASFNTFGVAQVTYPSGHPLQPDSSFGTGTLNRACVSTLGIIAATPKVRTAA